MEKVRPETAPMIPSLSPMRRTSTLTTFKQHNFQVSPSTSTLNIQMPIASFFQDIGRPLLLSGQHSQLSHVPK